MATDIIKRRIDVYPASWEQRECWQEEAKKRGMPLTKFIIFTVEEAISTPVLDTKQENSEMLHAITKQQEEIKELRRELNRTKKLISVQEEELEQFRNKAFLEKSFSGERTFNPELISLLRGSKRPLSDEELMRELNIPPTNPDSIKALSSQLEAIQEIKLVKLTKAGWRWIG